MSLRRYALIVAGGSGTRMGYDMPKQFIELAGVPILMRTIQLFELINPKPHIIVVLPANQIKQWEKLCKTHNFSVDHKVVIGGETRFHSVLNGLLAIDDENSVVAIHDGVRPLVNNKVVENCYSVAELNGCAVPVIQPVESVRLVSGDATIAFDRNKIMMVQTPQVFRTDIIKRSYNQPYQGSFTDDASVAESLGVKIFTVDGNRENIKITTPMDLLLATVLLQNQTI